MQAHLLDTRSQLLAAEAEKRACEQRALAPLVAQLHKALIELAQRDGFAEPSQLHTIRQKLVLRFVSFLAHLHTHCPLFTHITVTRVRLEICKSRAEHTVRCI